MELINPTKEIASPRTRFGKISDSNTHITGPSEIAKLATKPSPEALRGAEAVGLVRADERHFFCAGIPLLAGGMSLEGVLVLGLAMDEAYVLQMKRQSGAEVAMITRQSEPRVIATTLGTGEELLAAIRARGTLESLIPQRGVSMRRSIAIAYGTSLGDVALSLPCSRRGPSARAMIPLLGLEGARADI